MDKLTLVIGILQITLLDLALCGDNIGVIALATRNLPNHLARYASIIGIAGAIFLRIYFAACLSLFLKVKWLPIGLIGGIVLIKVCWDLIKPQAEEKYRTINESEKFWDAVLAVIIADVTMSLDNVLAIAGASNGNFTLIIFGILLNIPIIFLGSQLVVNLMRKHAIVIYIGGSILAYTSIRMILEDYWFKYYIHISPKLSALFPLLASIATLIYGFFMIYNTKNKLKLPNSRIPKAS